jgi:arsenite methyltransferase
MSETRNIPLTPVTSAGCCGDDCCGGAAATETIAEGADPRAVVREKYGAIAQGEACGCGCGCAPVDVEAVLGRIGYSAEQAAAIPEGANLGLGCGNPVAHAALEPGETVLDLGSGGGIDCFLAAREVGPTGRAIGVDMTPAMLERARATAIKVGANNVEFRLGEIEHLPIGDASVDCVISNCVVNLSPDKVQVFREALRVLRPGGRMLVSDLVLTRPLDPKLRNDVALYVGCVAGALPKEEYLAAIREAGFATVEVLAESGYDIGTEVLAADSPEREAFRSVVSVKVRATRA